MRFYDACDTTPPGLRIAAPAGRVYTVNDRNLFGKNVGDLVVDLKRVAEVVAEAGRSPIVLDYEYGNPTLERRLEVITEIRGHHPTARIGFVQDPNYQRYRSFSLPWPAHRADRATWFNGYLAHLFSPMPGLVDHYSPFLYQDGDEHDPAGTWEAQADLLLPFYERFGKPLIPYLTVHEGREHRFREQVIRLNGRGITPAFWTLWTVPELGYAHTPEKTARVRAMLEKAGVDVRG